MRHAFTLLTLVVLAACIDAPEAMSPNELALAPELALADDGLPMPQVMPKRGNVAIVFDKTDTHVTTGFTVNGQTTWVSTEEFEYHNDCQPQPDCVGRRWKGQQWSAIGETVAFFVPKETTFHVLKDGQVLDFEVPLPIASIATDGENFVFRYDVKGGAYEWRSKTGEVLY